MNYCDDANEDHLLNMEEEEEQEDESSLIDVPKRRRRGVRGLAKEAEKSKSNDAADENSDD